VASPREGRIVATILASAAVNDWLQTGFTWACRQANTAGTQADRLEQRGDGSRTAPAFAPTPAR